MVHQAVRVMTDLEAPLTVVTISAGYHGGPALFAIGATL